MGKTIYNYKDVTYELDTTKGYNIISGKNQIQYTSIIQIQIIV